MVSDNRESPAPPALARVEAHVLRWPVKVPVRTSFGTMHDRPAVLVRVEDEEGAHGWGEAWCNFPSCGAEHRARLIESVLAPLLVGRAFASPEAAFTEMSDKTAVLALAWARERVRLTLEEVLARTLARGSLPGSAETRSWLILAACEAMALEPPSAVADRLRALLELTGYAADLA